MNMNTQANDMIYQLVSFVVENEEFGVDILKVQEIIRTVEITRVPKSPPLCRRSHKPTREDRSGNRSPKTLRHRKKGS